MQELQEECNRMAAEYGRFDRKFAEERERANLMQQRYEKLEGQFDGLRADNKRQRLEIIDYEQRYKGIDVGKMHEQCMYTESQLHLAKL